MIAAVASIVEHVLFTDLVEVVDHEADVRVGHLLALALRVHLAPAGRRVHLHTTHHVTPRIESQHN